MRRLFKMEVVQGRRVKDVVAFYDTQEAAIAHVEKTLRRLDDPVSDRDLPARSFRSR
jgi:hypothetical protein